MIADVVMGFMAKAGFERDYGRRVVSDMEAAGLTDVRGEGARRLIDSTVSGFRLLSAVLRKPSRAVVEAGCCRPRKPMRHRPDSVRHARCSRRSWWPGSAAAPDFDNEIRCGLDTTP